MKRRHLAVLAPVAAAAAVAVLAAPSSNADTGGFVMKAGTAGNIRVAADPSLTFVFTGTNQTGHLVQEDIALIATHNVDVTSMACVFNGMSGGGGGGPFCESSGIKAGQRVGIVVDTTVTGPSGSRASVKACLENEDTGKTTCRTVSATIF